MSISTVWGKVINFFQVNGMIKLLSAVVVFVVLALLNQNSSSTIYQKLMIIPGIYVGIVFVLLLVYGFIGMFNDIKNWNKK